MCRMRMEPCAAQEGTHPLWVTPAVPEIPGGWLALQGLKSDWGYL